MTDEELIALGVDPKDFLEIRAAESPHPLRGAITSAEAVARIENAPDYTQEQVEEAVDYLMRRGGRDHA